MQEQGTAGVDERDEREGALKLLLGRICCLVGLLLGAGGWLTISLIEASAGILALLLAAVALGERIERGVEGPHYVSLIRLTARGGFATIAPAVSFDVLKVTTTSVAGEGLVITALVVVQIVLLAATIGAFAFMLSCLWATLRVTFVGVPESAPEEDQEEAEESTGVRS